MTADDMTNRDAAQIAALPKSAVWSQLGSDGVLAGGAGSRPLTSGRTDHTSSPATSEGRPKRLSLAGSGRTCEEVRETMRKHTKHWSAAGVALTGGVGGARAVWHDERRAEVAAPPGTGPLAHHAGR